VDEVNNKEENCSRVKRIGVNSRAIETRQSVHVGDTDRSDSRSEDTRRRKDCKSICKLKQRQCSSQKLIKRGDLPDKFVDSTLTMRVAG